VSARLGKIASVKSELAAKDKEISALKSKASKAENDNAVMKARLGQIEKRLNSK